MMRCAEGKGGAVPVGAVLGLGGIPTIRTPRPEVNRVQPYRRNAAQTKHRSHKEMCVFRKVN